jgi:hypothetical protein
MATDSQYDAKHLAVRQVTIAEAKALGFESTKGITKEGGMYKFDTSLAPDRGGFQSVGVAKAGQPQMTPYFGDVTGAYRLTQEQYGAAGMTNGVMNTQALLDAMNLNERNAGILPRRFDIGSSSASITATPPAPEPELFSAAMFSAPPVKTATLDIILFDEESVPTDGMFDQIFENIGGQELISITRSDIVNGQKISYQPIKNLSAIQQRYNPNNILSLQQTADKFFAGFSIKLEDKIPEIGNGANGENVYLNASGDLVIEFININADEQVETLISSSGTIYEADLGDYTS